MKNKHILKFQIGGIQRDATSVNKQEKQLAVKPKSNASLLIESTREKPKQKLFQLTPQQQAEYKRHVDRGESLDSNGNWVTKEQNEANIKSKLANRSTGAIEADYSDPITMGITMATAPAQGLLKTTGQKVLPKLANSKVGKVVAEGIDMLDPTSVGLNLKDAITYPFRKRVYETISPYGYNPNKIKNIILNKPEIKNNILEKRTDLPIRDEVWKKYLKLTKDKNLKHIAKNSDGTYRFTNEEKLKNLAENDYAYESLIGNKYDKFKPDVYTDKDGVKRVVSMDVDFDVMGGYNTKLGKDDKGRYLQFEDTWDIHPLKGWSQYTGFFEELPIINKFSDKYKKAFTKKLENVELGSLIGAKPVKLKQAWYIDDRGKPLLDEFGKVMQKPLSLLPAAIGTGLGIKASSNQESKKKGGLFKKGGKVDCGCDMDKDGIDTDILKLLPQTIADILHSKIGISKGVKYDDSIKNKLKEDAKLKGVNLREYLTENPLVSKQIITIEKMKQGGVIKHQTGGLKTKHGMIYNAQKPLDKKVLYSEMTDMEKDMYMKRPAVKPVKTSDGYLDDEQTTNKLITTVFGNMPEEQRTLQLESFAEKHPDIAERLTMGEFNDTDVNKLKLFVDMNTKKKFQFGGLQTMLNSTESVKDIESTIKQTINPMLRNNIPQQQMQQGGQVNEQQKFIQWLAQKLGVKSQEELQAAIQKMGKQGIQKAQQMYQQEMNGGGQQMAKKGGMFRFQTGGKYKPTKNVSAAELKASDVIDKNSKAYKDVRDRYLKDSFRKYQEGAEMVTPEPKPDSKPSLYGSIPTYTTTDRFRQGFKAMNNGKTVLHTAYNDDKTKAVQLRFTAGTWDDTDPNKTNNYNNIKSSDKFDATKENAQKKLDYSGFGYRTQFGTQGNRGKQGINLTDRLAQEREQDFKRMETNPEDYLPGGKEYHRVDPKTGGLKSRDGKYILGMFESKPSEKPPGDIPPPPKVPPGVKLMRETIPHGDTDKVVTDPVTGKKILIPGDPNGYHIEYYIDEKTGEKVIVNKIPIPPGSNAATMTAQGQKDNVTTETGTSSHIPKKRKGGMFNFIK